MAFDPADLSDVAACNKGRTLFLYQTADSMATVLGAGYFNAAEKLLSAGDSIIVTAADGEGIVRVPIARGGVVAVSEGSTIASGALATGSVGRSVAAELRDLGSPLTRWGAVGDGTTDITSYLDDAWGEATTQAFAASGQGRALATFELFLPPGSYRYAGAGLTMAANSSFILRGVPGRTRLVIDADVYLISISGAYLYGRLEGIDFVGGKGVWRVTRKTSIGGSIRNPKTITDCTFCDYTEAAIASNSDDDAMYKISNCRFTGTTTSKAICLPPGGGHDVVGNWFNRGKYPIHIRDGQDTRILSNRFGGLETNDSWDIWIDRAAKTNAGNGLIIQNNYHGTENDSATNSQILVADSTTSGNADHSTAPTWEVYQHSTTANASGAIRGVTIRGNTYAFPSGRTAGVVLSYFERLGGWVYEGNHHWGTCPYLFEFRSGVSALSAFAASNTFVNTNVVRYDQDHNIAVSAVQVRAVSNIPGFGQVYDPAGILTERDGVHVAGAGAGSTPIDLTPTSALTAVSGTTTVASASADGFGALTNRQITVNSADGRCTAALVVGSAVAGRLTWLEFEAKQGGSNPIAGIQIRIGSAFSTYYWSREVALKATRRLYRYSFVLPNTSAANIFFIGPTAYYSASTNVFDVSRIRIYQSPCPIDWAEPNGYLYSTAASTDATPSVLGVRTLTTANASATTITALDDGIEGQEVLVLIADANTTVDFTGTTLKGNGGSDWSPANGDFMRCRKIGSNWYCTVTDATA